MDEDHGIIEQVVGLYTPAQIDALKQQWGKPTFGEDYWMGANWLAEVGSNCGSEPPCFVYFSRAPNQQFFGKSPVPPLGLAKLGFDMPRAEVTTLFGLEPDGFVATGYGYTVSFDFTDDKLRSVALSGSSMLDTDGEIAYLAARWGAPAAFGDDAKLWVDTTAHWAAIHDVGQIRYYPLVLWNDLLAKDGPYSVLAASAQLLGRKEAEVGTDARAWPGTEVDPTETITVEPSFDDELVTSVSFRIDLPEDAIARHAGMIEKAFGRAKQVKDEDGDERSVITTGGLAIQLDEEDWGITLTVSKSGS
jgi:hypothetical protein